MTMPLLVSAKERYLSNVKNRYVAGKYSRYYITLYFSQVQDFRNFS